MTALDVTRAVLARQQAWNDVIAEARAGLPPMTVPDAHDWLAQVPRLPPSPAEQLAFITRWARAAGYRTPQTTSLAMTDRPRRPRFTPTTRQLEIAIAALDAQEAAEAERTTAA